jgi:HD-like signal output (HDOD) protein
VSIPDIFSLICQLRKSGELTLVTEVKERNFLFHTGNLVCATTRSQSRRLGNYLSRMGLLTPADFDDPILCGAGGDAFLGKRLLESGKISPEQLRLAVHAQIIDIFREVLNWEGGVFHFDDHEIGFEVPEGTLVSTQSVLLEAARISDEDQHTGSLLSESEILTQPTPAAKSWDDSACLSFFDLVEKQEAGKVSSSGSGRAQDARAATRSQLPDIAGSRARAPAVPELRCLLVAPDVPGRVFTLLREDDPKVLLAEILAGEPMLVAKILKITSLCNIELRRSSMSVEKLVKLLDPFQLRSILLPEAVRGLFYPRWDAYVRLHWERARLCAQVCQALAVETQYPFPGEAYLAGLLHDLGVFVLLSQDPVRYGEVAAESRASGVDLDKLETKAFGLSHCQAGGFYAEHWKLPRLLLAAIKQHHRVDGNVSNPLVHLVVVANGLLQADGSTACGRFSSEAEQCDKSLARLKLNAQKAREVFEKLRAPAAQSVAEAVTA